MGNDAFGRVVRPEVSIIWIVMIIGQSLVFGVGVVTVVVGFHDCLCAKCEPVVFVVVLQICFSIFVAREYVDLSWSTGRC